MQQPAVASGGNVVEIHISAHEAADSSIGSSFERDQIRVPHLFFGNVRGIVVAAAISSAVSCEVFCAGKYMVRCADLRSLESQHLSAGNRSPQIWIFTRSFNHASPPCIASNIQHWGEGPGNSNSAGFARGYGLRRLN